MNKCFRSGSFSGPEGTSNVARLSGRNRLITLQKACRSLVLLEFGPRVLWRHQHQNPLREPTAQTQSDWTILGGLPTRRSGGGSSPGSPICPSHRTAAKPNATLRAQPAPVHPGLPDSAAGAGKARDFPCQKSTPPIHQDKTQSRVVLRNLSSVAPT